MTEPIQYEIYDFRGQALANQFWAADEPNGWLSLILPGRGYTSDMPLMFFTRRMLLWRGVDVLNLNPAARSDAFQNSTEEEKLTWLKADVLSGLTAGLSARNYKGILLAGKSIGSLAIAQAVAEAETYLPTTLIWITPLMRWQVVVDAALKAVGPQVHVCGGADPTYDAEKLNQIIAEKPLANAFVAPGANHILEVQGDEQATFRGICEAMLFVGNFLDRTFANAPNTPGA
ncbi:MAG: hypothetical protein ACYC6H_11765 [Bellilinea sp.]